MLFIIQLINCLYNIFYEYENVLFIYFLFKKIEFSIFYIQYFIFHRKYTKTLKFNRYLCPDFHLSRHCVEY